MERQHLTDGFPVLVTRFRHDGVSCEVEQFAYPLHGRPPKRRGDIAMVLLSRVTFTEQAGRPRLHLATRTDPAFWPPLKGGISIV